jgi:hypothetical protein
MLAGKKTVIVREDRPMKCRRLSALAVLLALLVACLVSVPALSGEHPWDADVDGGRGDSSLSVLPDYGDPNPDTVFVLDEGDSEPEEDVNSKSVEAYTAMSRWVTVIAKVVLWYATRI